MKRVFTLFLALIMAVGLLSLAGCADNNNQTSSTPTPTATKTPTPTPTAAEPSDEPDDGEFKLPIVDTPVDFDAWMVAGGISATSGMLSLADSYAYKEAERLTNVRVKFTHPSAVGERESFNLLFASDMLPDMIIGGTLYYIGGTDRYIDDGFIVDLTDFIDEHCPNYKEARQVSEVVYKSTTSDTGRLSGFWQIYYSIQPSFMGLVYRNDLLQKYGLEVPETYDQWHEMLTMMKDDTAVAPAYIGAITGVQANYLSGYGATPEFMQINGKVTYGPAQPGYRDYIDMMRQWYSEKLLDPDFFSRTSFVADHGLFAKGDIAVMPQLYTYIDVIEASATVPGIDVRAVASPVVTKGDMRVAVASLTTHRGGSIATISTKCKDVVTACLYFEFFFSEVGARIGNYGVEDQGFTYVNGKPMLTELVTKNPDGLSLNDGMLLYTFSALFPRRYSWERELTDAMSQKAQDAGNIWDSNFDIPNSYGMPAVSLTADESGEYSAVYGDIKTFLDESAASFIMGNKPMSEYDAFVDQLWTMGLQKCIDFQQAALDRFNARPGLGG